MPLNLACFCEVNLKLECPLCAKNSHTKNGFFAAQRPLFFAPPQANSLRSAFGFLPAI